MIEVLTACAIVAIPILGGLLAWWICNRINEYYEKKLMRFLINLHKYESFLITRGMSKRSNTGRIPDENEKYELIKDSPGFDEMPTLLPAACGRILLDENMG